MTVCGVYIDHDAAVSAAMLSGYLALLIALLWRLPHCPDCPRKEEHK